MSILYVDDDPEDIEILHEAIKSVDPSIEYLTAHTASEAPAAETVRNSSATHDARSVPAAAPSCRTTGPRRRTASPVAPAQPALASTANGPGGPAGSPAPR